VSDLLNISVKAAPYAVILASIVAFGKVYNGLQYSTPGYVFISWVLVVAILVMTILFFVRLFTGYPKLYGIDK
jgi:hypothetical protein